MNSSFNGRTQIVQILGLDGVTPVFVSLADITTWLIYNTQSSILYGAQMGALLIMLLITATLTSESKRRKPIFILNCLSLFFGFLRALLRALYSTSDWVDIYATFTYDYQYVPEIDYSTSVAGNVFNLLMTITVNSSLFLQAYTVAKTMTQKQRLVISFFSAVMIMASIGSRFAATITNNIAIVQGVYLGSDIVTIAVAEAIECATYWYFSLIFTGKLVWTVRARYTMGLRRWDITQVLCVMGFCTMVIPSIFASLDYVVAIRTTFPQSGTLAITLVALLLPMSSLWCTMVTTDAGSSFNVSNLWASVQSKGGSQESRKTFGFTSTSPSTMERKSSLPICPIISDTFVGVEETHRRDSTEADLERMGVRVNRTYEVNSSN